MSDRKTPSPRTVYSDEERRQIIRNFIDAYLAHEIKIEWPTKQDYEQSAKEGYIHDDIPPVDLEKFGKQLFNEWIMLVSGYKESTYDEVEEAFRDFFYFIISGLTGDKIRGSFFKGTNVEQRLKDLEDKVASHDRLIQSIRMMDHVGGNDNDNLPQV
jgi:hypothetical protein